MTAPGAGPPSGPGGPAGYPFPETYPNPQPVHPAPPGALTYQEPGGTYQEPGGTYQEPGGWPGLTKPAAPPPPPGPGVQVPFGAPPSERDRKRMWIALGVTAGVVVLVCIAGVFGIGALAVTGNRAIQQNARDVVTQYLDGLKNGDFSQSYDQLCAALHEQTDYPDFAQRLQDQPRVDSYVIDTPQLESSSVLVRTHVTLDSGTQESPLFQLVARSAAMTDLRICGIRE